MLNRRYVPFLLAAALMALMVAGAAAQGPTPVPVTNMSDHIVQGTNDVVTVLQEGLGPVIAGALGIFALIKGLNYVRGLL